MGLSEDSLKLNSKSTLEAILDSEYKDKLIKDFVDNFDRIKKYKLEIETILNNEYFKQKIINGELNTNLDPLIDYLIKNKKTDYKVNKEYLHHYYFSKNGMINEQFVELYSSSVDEFKILKERYGEYAIHLSFIPEDKIHGVIDVLSSLNEKLNKAQVIEVIRLATPEIRLKPNNSVDNELMEKIFKRVYSSKKIDENHSVLLWWGIARESYLFNHTTKTFEKLNSYKIKEEEHLIFNDNLAVVEKYGKLYAGNVYNFGDNIIIYTENEPRVLVFNRSENKIIKEINARLLETANYESPRKEDDVLILTRERNTRFNKYGLLVYYLSENHLEKITTFKDSIEGVAIGCDSLFIKSGKNIYMLQGNKKKKIKEKLIRDMYIQGYDTYIVKDKTLCIDWNKHDVKDCTDQEL